MKGIVFTEFVELVEDKFSPELADQIIIESDLASNGAYTSVSTYDHAEMVELVTKLSEKTDIAIPTLLITFGEFLLDKFVEYYPVFFNSTDDSFAFLESVESHVHVEVKKLYHDAELPSFKTERENDDTLIMTYSSSRPFADLAQGLIQGTAKHYQQSFTIEREDWLDNDINVTQFTIHRD